MGNQQSSQDISSIGPVEEHELKKKLELEEKLYEERKARILAQAVTLKQKKQVSALSMKALKVLHSKLEKIENECAHFRKKAVQEALDSLVEHPVPVASAQKVVQTLPKQQKQIVQQKMDFQQHKHQQIKKELVQEAVQQTKKDRTQQKKIQQKRQLTCQDGSCPPGS